MTEEQTFRTSYNHNISRCVRRCANRLILKDCKFSGTYFQERIFDLLCEILAKTHVRYSANPIVHKENAKPHIAHKTENYFQSCGFHYIPQPPYNPDINPHNFSFLTLVKIIMRKRV
jgi:hypothetical protein